MAAFDVAIIAEWGYWAPKLEHIPLRGKQHRDALASAGWQSLVVWECETCDEKALRLRIEAFLKRAKG